MATARSFDVELAALEALRDADPASRLEAIRKALTHRNNLIVAKAAKLAALYEHRELMEELAEAFYRFLPNEKKLDPQCWAKTALAEALAGFEYQEDKLFLAGMHHLQLEASWGPPQDSAGQLRGVCALALVQCRSLSAVDVLARLTPLFTDKVLPVRVNAARAVEQIGSDAAMLLLRLRAELGSDEPELLGACYSGVLRLEGARAIPWAGRFLAGGRDGPDEASVEAAFAIAETRTEDAFTLLRTTWKQTRDRDFKETLLTAIALTRQEPAVEFLLNEAADGNAAARQALEASAPGDEILDRLAARLRPL